jgi:hypothetical protein
VFSVRHRWHPLTVTISHLDLRFWQASHDVESFLRFVGLPESDGDGTREAGKLDEDMLCLDAE